MLQLLLRRPHVARGCAVVASHNHKRAASSSSSEASKETGGSSGFFGTFFDKRQDISPQTTAHSAQLSMTRDHIIELQTHNVKPDSVAKYVNAHKELVEYINANKERLHCEAVGNFVVFVGDEDQFIHVWRFDEGYRGIDKTLSAFDGDQTYQKLRQQIVPLLRSRHSQYLMPFSFWPEVYMRKQPHIYELRSYHLKPGTMVEWGNYWARAIRMRDKKDHPTAFMGTFSQVGELYNVKHMWCYDSLDDRRDSREDVWHQSGWNEIVAKTTPLIRNMTSRIMRPLDYSGTK